LKTLPYYSSSTRNRYPGVSRRTCGSAAFERRRSHSVHRPGGGFVVLLPNSYSKAVATVNTLYDNAFLDYQTRALFVEWLVYNLPTGQRAPPPLARAADASGPRRDHKVPTADPSWRRGRCPPDQFVLLLRFVPVASGPHPRRNPTLSTPADACR
jgi:hypothetical protein